MTPKLERIAVKALHKLALEVQRGTASPRCEYDIALARLDEMKRQVPDWRDA